MTLIDIIPLSWLVIQNTEVDIITIQESKSFFILPADKSIILA